MNSFEKAQATIGCVAILMWLGGIGVVITIAVLIIKALLKYIGS